MKSPANSSIELNVSRGTGVYLHLNGRLVHDSCGAIVMAELAQLRDFPDVRVDVHLRSRQLPCRGRHGAADRHGARPQRNLGLKAGRTAVRGGWMIGVARRRAFRPRQLQYLRAMRQPK